MCVPYNSKLQKPQHCALVGVFKRHQSDTQFFHTYRVIFCIGFSGFPRFLKKNYSLLSLLCQKKARILVVLNVVLQC